MNGGSMWLSLVKKTLAVTAFVFLLCSSTWAQDTVPIVIPGPDQMALLAEITPAYTVVPSGDWYYAGGVGEDAYNDGGAGWGPNSPGGLYWDTITGLSNGMTISRVGIHIHTYTSGGTVEIQLYNADKTKATGYAEVEIYQIGWNDFDLSVTQAVTATTMIMAVHVVDEMTNTLGYDSAGTTGYYHDTALIDPLEGEGAGAQYWAYFGYRVWAY